MGDRSLLRFRFWASLCDLTCDLTCSRFVFCSPARSLFSVRPRAVCFLFARAGCAWLACGRCVLRCPCKGWFCVILWVDWNFRGWTSIHPVTDIN